MRLYDPLCPSVSQSVGLSVTLSLLSPFFVVLSHFKSFHILSFSLDNRMQLRGVGLVFLFLFSICFLFFFLFLAADTKLYKRLCLSVGPLVYNDQVVKPGKLAY